MRRSILLTTACLLALAAPTVTHAVITFTQLAGDTFVVSHRVKGLGSRGQAMRLVYTKAASLCVAAGFSHLEIHEQESQASQQYESANASVRVQLFMAGGEGRIDCEMTANPEYVAQARTKLAAKGYRPPPPAWSRRPARSPPSQRTKERPPGPALSSRSWRWCMRGWASSRSRLLVWGLGRVRRRGRQGCEERSAPVRHSPEPNLRS